MAIDPTTVTVYQMHAIENTCLVLWQDGDFRFHIRVDQDSLELSPDFSSICKNPLVEQPGRVGVRLLDPEARANAAMLANVRDIVRTLNLVQKRRDEDAVTHRERERHFYLRSYAMRVWRARMYRHPDPERPADISESDFWVYSDLLAREMFKGCGE